MKKKNNLEKYNSKIFEDIKHVDEEGNEYWLARELMIVLEYKRWENFHKVIKSAMSTCENSNYNIANHFPEVRKMVNIGSGAQRKQEDYKLSRYACYLIVNM